MSGTNQIELKGGMYTFMSLKPETTDLEAIDQQLADKVKQAPGFFRDTPVVVDLTVIEQLVADGAHIDIKALIKKISAHKLLPIVASVTDKSSSFTTSIGLPLVEAYVKRQSNDGKPGADAAGESPATAGQDRAGKLSLADTIGQRANGDKSASSKSGAASHQQSKADATLDTAAKQVEMVVKMPKLVSRPVRSGQQVYARDTDLIIMGSVGPGAEVVSDSNIHVYGPLRGKALCGVTGKSSSRIFCQSLEAELVSVAGNYRVLEEIPENLRGKPAQIFWDNNKLNIEPL